ncbi:hypothetical protein, partial [Burkholderia vietnamiensis]|uniref:hypothetical protein n=1 Tax=Burkholderia vietnamiensis TaxID=60552 RepID=UPI001ABB3A9D
GALGHVPEMTGHVAEIAGHDPETAGHVRPKYALAQRLGKKQAYVLKIEVGERHIGFMDFIEWCEACSADPAEVIKRI